MAQPVDYEKVQTTFFLIESFPALLACLRGLEQHLELGQNSAYEAPRA